MHHYTAHHHTDCDLFAETVTFAYNSQVQTSTGIALFKLVLSRRVSHLTLENPAEGNRVTAKTARERSVKRLELLLPEMCDNIAKAEQRYRCKFERRQRPLRDIPIAEACTYLR